MPVAIHADDLFVGSDIVGCRRVGVVEWVVAEQLVIAIKELQLRNIVTLIISFNFRNLLIWVEIISDWVVKDAVWLSIWLELWRCGSIREGATNVGNAALSCLAFKLNRFERNVCSRQYHFRPLIVDLTFRRLFPKQGESSKTELSLWLLPDPKAEHKVLSESIKLPLDSLLNLYSLLPLALKAYIPCLLVRLQQIVKGILVECDAVEVVALRLRQHAVRSLVRASVVSYRGDSLVKFLLSLRNLTLDRVLDAGELSDLVLCILRFLLMIFLCFFKQFGSQSPLD